MVLQHELLPELPGAEVDILTLPIVGRYLLVLLNHLQGPDLFPPEVPHDPGPKNIWVAAVVDEGDVVVKTALCRVVESGVWANLDVAVGKNSQQFAPLVSSVVFPEVKIWILGAEFFNIDILTSQCFDILRGIMQVEYLGPGFIIKFVHLIFKFLRRIPISGEVQVDPRHLLHDDLPGPDLPGGEESPALARSLSDGEGRTGGLVSLPVPHLTLLAAVRRFSADTTFQFLPGLRFTETAGSHRSHLVIKSGVFYCECEDTD